jgi:hypothetical protein
MVMKSTSISRRKFLRETSAGAAGALGASMALPGVAGAALAAPVIDYAAVPAVDRKQLFAAFGDTLIPTATGYPGYRRLEAHGISEEVMKSLTGISADDLNVFNAAAREYFDRPFAELNEANRTVYLERIAASFPAGMFGVPLAAPAASETLNSRLPKEQLDKVQRVFRLARTVVFTVFYQNFPENRIRRDADRTPVLSAGDLHQIINPNTAALITGWDVANFPGPLTWDEEEKRRAYWKKTHWHDDE